MKALKTALVVAAVVLLAAAVPAAAQDNEGSASPGQQERYDALFQQMLEDPDDLDVMFEFAKVATRLGNYEAAISTLERMLLFNPNLPRVRLELGVLYFRIGSYEAAQTYFEQVRQRENVPETVLSRVDSYLARIRERRSRHAFSGSVFTGVRYQTNANAGPGDPDVKAGGVDAILDDQFLEEDDFNGFATVFLRHGYDLQTPLDERWDSTLFGHSTRHFELTQFDVDFLEATTGPRVAFLPGELDDAFVRPHVLANVVRLDRKLLTKTGGAGIEASKPIGARLFTQADYQFRYKNFDNSSGQPTAGQRTGVENEVRLAAFYGLTPQLTLNGRLRVLHKEAKRNFNSFLEYSALVGGRLRYKAPVEELRWPWTAALSARVMQADYESPDPAVDPTNERLDTEYRFTFSNTFRLNDMFAVELQAQHVINESDLPNFEFDNTSVTLGGSLRF